VRKNRALLAVAAAAFVAAGCYDRVPSGDEVVYTFQPWIALTIGGASLAVAAAGVFLVRRAKRPLGVTLILVGVLVFAVLCPGAFHDRVVIGPDRLYLTTGFWFAPNEREVRLADVERASVEVVVWRRRFGPQKHYYLNCRLKSGRVESFPVGDLMKRAYPEIIETIRKKNIPLYIPPDAAAVR
jgi:hypothetical protein